MKYKVGDKVRVRSDLKENIRYGGQIFVEIWRYIVERMLKFQKCIMMHTALKNQTVNGSGQMKCLKDWQRMN